MRAVTLNNFSKGFNQLVLFDFFFSEDLQLFYCVDALMGYSLVVIVYSLPLPDTISAFEERWVSHFQFLR